VAEDIIIRSQVFSSSFNKNLIQCVLLSMLLGTFLVAQSSEQICGDSLCQKTVHDIRSEALRGNNDPIGRALPLAAHWNVGAKIGGFDPEYQIGLIKKGHRIFPWLPMPHPSRKSSIEYYEKTVIFFRDQGLPISFISTQWESILTTDERFKSLSPDENPNVVTFPEGKILNKVSPFSPLGPWIEAGRVWTSTSMLRLIQKIYPDPPKVLFISNNEHSKLRWYEVKKSDRFLESYGMVREAEEIRRLIGDKWIERYRALQSGMREGLIAESWRNNSLFIGYDAFGGSAFGRWPGWKKYSLYVKGRIEPWPLAWDGASVSFYVHNWDPSTDYNLMSPQIQGMNWVFMLKEAYQYNPDFWFEISTWDGDSPGKHNDMRKYYRDLGQDYGPVRYEGMVQFGMWLLRPRVVREFRGWTDTVTRSGAYFDSVLRSVDRVYNNPLLKRFWRKGKLVANRKHRHPFQSAIPEEYKDEERWFLLDSNANPPRPWDLDTKLNLFALALAYREGTENEYLLYLFAPTPISGKVRVTVPGYGDVAISSVSKWGFYHLAPGRQARVILASQNGSCLH